MNSNCETLIKKLSEHVNEDDFIYYCEDIVDQLIEIDKTGETIPSILELMEKHTEVDFGLPGPLVHFVERFFKNGYEEYLYESIKNVPTMHTLWMLNRVINGSKEEDKEKLVDLISNICKDEKISDVVRNYACELYEFQVND